MTYEVIQPGCTLWLGYNLSNQYGVEVFDYTQCEYTSTGSRMKRAVILPLPGYPPRLLNTGSYLVGAAIFNHQEQLIHCHEREVGILSRI